MRNEINELIQALSEGVMTLDEVAHRFRQRTWPATSLRTPTNYLELAVAALRDPEPDVPGSFDDVIAAYNRGQITGDQYRVLADAVADAIGRKPQPE